MKKALAFALAIMLAAMGGSASAQNPISGMTTASSLPDTAIFYLILSPFTSGNDRKITGATVKSEVLAGIDTEAELETLLGSVNVILATEIDTEAELEALVAGVNLIVSTEIDSEAELEALLGAANVIVSTEIDTLAELEAFVGTLATQGELDTHEGNASIHHTATVALTQEQVEDFAGAAWTLNTETRATVTYQDADGTIDIVVDDMNDDVPESGDFANAADLESTGALSIDVVAAAEMADADHGQVSWSSGVATVEDMTCADCINDTEIATNAGTALSADLEEEGEVNATAVTGNAADDQMLLGSGASAAAWVAMPAGGTDGCSAAADKPIYTASTNSWSCGADAGAGGGMTSFTVQGDDAGTMTITDGETVDIAGGLGLTTTAVTGSPEQLTMTFDWSQTLAGNPALLVDQCIFSTTATGGCFLCEGSTADTSEQLYCFQDLNGADTTAVIVTEAGTQTLTGKTIDATNTVTINAADVTDLSGSTDITADLEEEAHCSEHASTDVSCSGETLLVTDDQHNHTTTTISGLVDADITFTSPAIAAATATTPSADDNDTSVATTAYVQTEINALGGTDLTCAAGTCNVDNPVTAATTATTANAGDSATAFFSGGEIEDAYLVDTLTASNYLPLGGGAMTAEFTADALGIEFEAGDAITDCTTFSATGGGIFFDDSEGVLKKCEDNALTVLDTTGGTPAFSDISGATNTTAAMVVGTGASLAVSGSGTIVATSGDSATSFFASGEIADAQVSDTLTCSALSTTAGIADVTVTATELEELATIGATVIEAADWTAVAAMSGVNTGDNTVATTGDSATSFFSSGTLEVGIGGTGAATFTDGGILLGSGSGAITALGAATNGQIPIGDGTTDPVLATITGGRSTTVTNGAGTITVAADAELYTSTKCFTLETPADADDFLFWRTNTAITVTEIDCIVNAATSVVVTVEECDANGGTCTAIEAAMTCAATNTAHASAIDNAAVDAGDWMRVDIGAVTGTPGHVSVCMVYTEDD